MSHPFRVIDTGVREGRRQIAFDQALIELHKAGRAPDTVRFLRFPPTVLIGRHQVMRHEVRLEYCRAHGIGLVRRITGGGAIYLDEGQAGWELVLSRRRLGLPALADYSRAICEAVAHGLQQCFGIAARFRAPTDIEVDGRKLCGTGGTFDGDTLVYQGTVLVDIDPARIAASLNLPGPAAGPRPAEVAAAPASRMTTLKALFGGEAPDVLAVQRAISLGLTARLGIELRHGTPSAEEEALADRLHAEEIGTDAFTFGSDLHGAEGVHQASRATAGGRVAAFVRLEGQGEARRIREVLLTGDFHAEPPRTILDLEASLRGVTVRDAGEAVARFFRAVPGARVTVAPEAFRAVLEAAIAAPPSGT
jgi:lipoate-protein ligase A